MPQKIDKIKDIVVEVIDSLCDQDVPSGHLYVVLMDIMSLDEYQQMMGSLVQEGRIRNVGNFCYRSIK